jgi:hypothetical protein
MKISKLIIPLLGLTSVNNNTNRQELLKLEKLPEISYEVSAKDNWDNYLVVDGNFNEMQNEITQLSARNIPMENGGSSITPINYNPGCDALLDSMLAGCARYWYNPA